VNVLLGAPGSAWQAVPGRIRTRDPLLRRHTLTVARRRWVRPDRQLSCGYGGWQWLGIA
jgi:hypothetical protein